MSTPMTEAEKKWIDEASYTELLRLWRFQSAGSLSLFQGESGSYCRDKLHERQREVGPEEHTRVSKAIGWGTP